MKRTGTIILAAALCIAVVFVLWKVVLQDAPSRPNIILVTLDTTRTDRLGCYGYGKPTSPHIDELAGEGVRFELTIAQAAVTPVSHASILTGLYPFEHGLRVLHGETCYRLEEGEHPTLPAVLRENGWETAAFVSSFPVSEYFGLNDGFDVFDTGILGDIDQKMLIDDEGRASWAVDRNQRRADVTTDRALDWLGKRSGAFFLWLHFFDPHDPCLVPPTEDMKPFLKGYNTMSREDQTRTVYDAEVFFMDKQIGRLIAFLRERGLYDDTVILVTNDHGEGLGDHDWWFHRILYQEQISMPLIVRHPSGPRGRVVPDLVRSIDIMPTLLEYAGIEPPPMSGKSLVGLIDGKQEPPRTAYSDALIRLDDNRPRHADRSHNNDLMYCVIMDSRREGGGIWKLIYRRFHEEDSELYRLDRDPGEEFNVIAEYPEEQDRLFEFLKPKGIMIEKLIRPAQNNDAQKRLEQLGY